jgi:hypothetical protein
MADGGSQATAQGECGGGEGLGLLTDQQPGLALALNGGLLDSGHGSFESVPVRRGDRDQSGETQVGVTDRDLLLPPQDVLVFGRIGELGDLPEAGLLVASVM